MFGDSRVLPFENYSGYRGGSYLLARGRDVRLPAIVRFCAVSRADVTFLLLFCGLI